MDMYNNVIRKNKVTGTEEIYDGRGNLIYSRSFTGFERVMQYDEKNRLIRYKDSNGTEFTRSYDSQPSLMEEFLATSPLPEYDEVKEEEKPYTRVVDVKDL